MFIYAIQNKVNSKIYFGQTVQDLEYYWNYNTKCALNGKDYKPALYAAMSKYGKENFTFIHIGTTDSKESLDNWERLAILVFGTQKREFGYNLTSGGDGTVGAERTEEWCKNISLGNMGKTWDEDRKKAASVQRKGKILSQEHKDKIGKGVKGTKKPEQWIEKLVARNKALKGKPKTPRTPEHQAKLSASKIANTLARKQKQLELERVNGFD